MAKDIELPMASWVKGGQPTSAYERQIAESDADAARRRAIQDQQFGAAATGQLPGALAGDGIQGDAPDAVARMASLKLGGRDSHASVVLALKHPKDSTILDWIVCELSQEPNSSGEQELVLIICCPRCVLTRHQHPQNAQMTIRQSNRMFYLDTRTEDQGGKAGTLWVNPKDPNECVTVAGTITTEDWISCPHVGCQYRFKIDNSVVHSS